MAGGVSNTASGNFAAVGGGQQNIASALMATVGGGVGDTASGESATVGGGVSNTASGYASTVPGGYGNLAQGNYSLAAGRWARANHNGSFVWADASSGYFESSTTNEFSVRAAGGVRIFSASDQSAGVTLATGGGSWSSVSDRNAKEHFAAVEGPRLLQRLDAIPVETWNYKSQDDSIRHIGPMAQDFYAAFGVGEDDKHISTVDADGVALAGVQALYRMSLERERENDSLRQEVRELRAMVEALQQRLGVEVSAAR